MGADRTTSFAKTVDGLVHEENALDRARSIKEQFLRAQNDNQPTTERETEKPPTGSQMVREDQPVFRPTPSGPMRQQDRQGAYSRLAQEKADASKNLVAAKRAHEAFKARLGKDKTHERDRDHER